QPPPCRGHLVHVDVRGLGHRQCPGALPRAHRADRGRDWCAGGNCHYRGTAAAPDRGPAPHRRPHQLKDTTVPETSPENTGYVRTDSMLGLIRTMLLRLMLVSAAITVLAVGIGYLVAGTPGVWAALIGAAISVVFNGATVLSMYLVAGRSPELLQIVLLGGWLVKMALLVIVLVWLREQTFYHKGVFVATLVVVVVAALIVEVVTVLRARIPYVEPTPSPAVYPETSHEPSENSPDKPSEERSDEPSTEPADGRRESEPSRATTAQNGESDVDHRPSQERHDSPNDQVG